MDMAKPSGDRTPISSVEHETAQYIEERLGRKFTLSKEQKRDITRIVGDILLGEVRIGNLMPRIKDTVGVPEQTARAMADDLCYELFAPAMNDIRRLYHGRQNGNRQRVTGTNTAANGAGAVFSSPDSRWNDEGTAETKTTSKKPALELSKSASTGLPEKINWGLAAALVAGFFGLGFLLTELATFDRHRAGRGQSPVATQASTQVEAAGSAASARPRQSDRGTPDSRAATTPMQPSTSVADVSDTPTTPRTAALVIYEAEAAEVYGSAKVNNEHSGYSGSGYVDGYGYEGLGSAITFRVTVNSAGDHVVHLRYANATGKVMTISVYVNGTRLIQSALPPLDSWSTWSEKPEVLSLVAGLNTVAFRYDPEDSGNINIDRISVESSAPFPAEGSAAGQNAAPLANARPMLSPDRVKVIDVGSTTATITWTTDQLTEGQVEYCPTFVRCGVHASVVPDLSMSHRIELTDLTPGTSYYIWVKSRDAAGNLQTLGYFLFQTTRVSEPGRHTDADRACWRPCDRSPRKGFA